MGQACKNLRKKNGHFSSVIYKIGKGSYENCVILLGNPINNLKLVSLHAKFENHIQQCATSVFQIVLCHFTVLKSKSCCSYNLCQLNFNLLLTVLQHKLECIIVSVETICPERFLSCFRPSLFISIHKSLCDHFFKENICQTLCTTVPIYLLRVINFYLQSVHNSHGTKHIALFAIQLNCIQVYYLFTLFYYSWI